MEPFSLLQWVVCEGTGNQHYQVMFLKPQNIKVYLKSVLHTITYAQNAFLMSISSSLTALYAEVCSCLKTDTEPADEQENGNKRETDWLLQMLQKM